MRAERTIKILSLSLAALAVLTLSAIATILYRVKAEKVQGEEIQIEMNAVIMSGMYFRQALNLSPQQMDEFRGINQSFRQRARDINHALDRYRVQIFNELKKENPDTVICNTLSAEIGNLHEDLKIETCSFFLAVKQICDPEQEQKLHELFEPVFSANFGFGYGRGGGRFRRGPQGNNNN